MRKNGIAALLCGLLLLHSAAAQAQIELPVDIGEAKAICLMEAQSQKVLLEYEAQTQMDAAGLVRLPALLLACEEADKGTLAAADEVGVSAEAAAVRGPTAFLSAGERIAAGDLYKSAIMITAGDALFTLTETLMPSEEIFVAKVNARLDELGVQGAYADRMGKDARFGAEELAKVGAALLQSPTFLNYSSLYYETLTHESGLLTEMASSNKLLKTCVGANGVSTGSSPEAGYCGVFSAQRDGNSFVCTVLGAKNAEERAKIAKALLEYAFAGYQVKSLAAKGETMAEGILVTGGTVANCTLIAAHDCCVVMPKAADAYSQKREIPETIAAPLRAGEALGRILYLDADGGVLAKIDLTVAEDIEKAVWHDFFLRAVGDFLHQ